MVTTYQIRNVLRIYGNQLKKRAMHVQDAVTDKKPSAEVVDISLNARKKQMLDQISNDMISQVASKENNKEVQENGAGDPVNKSEEEGNKL